MKHLYLYLFLLILVGCKYELPEALITRSCSNSMAIIYSVDASNPLKYNFTASNNSVINYPITWTTSTGLVLGTSSTNSFSYTFSSTGSYNIKASFKNSCGDLVSSAFNSIVVSTNLLIEKSFPLTDPMVGIQTKAVVSNDGIVIAIDGTEIKVWNYSTQSLVRSFKHSISSTSNITDIILSPDEDYLYTSNGSNIIQWDWKTGTNLKTIYNSGNRTLSLSANGEFLIFFDNGSTSLSNVISVNLKNSLLSQNIVDFYPYSLSISADGTRYNITDGSKNKTLVYETGTNAILWNYTNTKFQFSKISPDGKYVIFPESGTGSNVRNCQIWDIGQNKKLLDVGIPFSGRFYSEMNFSYDGNFLALGGEMIYDFKNQKSFYNRSPNNDQIPFIGSFSANNKFLVSSFEGRIQLYNLGTTLSMMSQIGFSRHKYYIDEGKVSTDAKTIVASDSYDLKVWDIKTGNFIYSNVNINKERDQYGGDLLQYRKNNIWVLKNKNIYKIDNQTKTLSQITFSNDIGVFYITNDETYYFVFQGNKMNVYNTISNSLKLSLDNTVSNSIYNNLKVSNDNKYFLFGSNNNLLKIFELSTGIQQFTSQFTSTPNALNFSSNNSDIISYYDYGSRAIKILNFKTNNVLNTFGNQNIQNQSIFSSNDQKFASISFNKTIDIYDLNSNTLVKSSTFNEHILDAQFNIEGTQINIITQKAFYVINAF